MKRDAEQMEEEVGIDGLAGLAGKVTGLVGKVTGLLAGRRLGVRQST